MGPLAEPQPGTGGPSGVAAVRPATANPALPSAHEMAQGLAHVQHLTGFEAGRNLLALGGPGGSSTGGVARSRPPPPMAGFAQAPPLPPPGQMPQPPATGASEASAHVQFGVTTAVPFRSTTVPAPVIAPPAVGASAGGGPNPLPPLHPHAGQAQAAAMEAAGRRAEAQAAALDAAGRRAAAHSAPAPAPVVRHGVGLAHQQGDATNQVGAVAMPTGGGP